MILHIRLLKIDNPDIRRRLPPVFLCDSAPVNGIDREGVVLVGRLDFY